MAGCLSKIRPRPIRESPDELRRLRAARRLAVPVEGDFWVFGYGSLLWHPGFPHVEVRKARLFGYHRRFCIYSHRHRGTPEVPGLVFGLDRGGSCRGLAFRIPAGEGEAVMEYLYDREMVTGVYIPRWVEVTTETDAVAAATFVVDRDHFQYAGRLSLEEMVEIVLQGRGIGGTCGEYLANTVYHLEALGLPDTGLRELLRRVEERAGHELLDHPHFE
jgi:cation transport protein ChaC